jgi:hypothetical protein
MAIQDGSHALFNLARPSHRQSAEGHIPPSARRNQDFYEFAGIA